MSKYYIINITTHEIWYSSDDLVAHDYADSDNYIVIDTECGIRLPEQEYKQIKEKRYGY